MTAEYILPSELIAIIAFWFGPPSVIAFLLQLRTFSSRGQGVSRIARAWVLFGTPVVSVLLGLALLVASPKYLSALGVKDLRIAGHTFPFLPLAYVCVAAVAFAFTWAALRKQQKAA
ncbi:hypothetical protein ACFJGW_00930 [Burkholderiaceae bacterium UC74_6]